MINLFGGKWEREHGLEGSDKFYIWADKIEDMEPDQIRRKFDSMENKFKDDVAEGKDIWPPSLAYFLALSGKARVNEQAYKLFIPKIAEHTHEEYQEYAKEGLEKIAEKPVVSDGEKLAAAEMIKKRWCTDFVECKKIVGLEL